MKTTLKTDITVKAICEGFVYNELRRQRIVWPFRQINHPAGVSA